MGAYVKIENMPLTEKMAIGILRREGFHTIRWASFIDWLCPYDFTAIKDGTQFFIEVKDDIYHLDAEKVSRLQQFPNILLLLVHTQTKTYEFFPLSDLGLVQGEINPKFMRKIDCKGRFSIPKIIRWTLGLKPRTLLEVEILNNNQLLLSEVK